MRDFVYTALTVAGIVATAVAAGYAFEYRGYFAIGGEYAFLSLPLLGMCVEYIADGIRERRHRDAGR